MAPKSSRIKRLLTNRKPYVGSLEQFPCMGFWMHLMAMTNIKTKHNFEKKKQNWVMFSGKMFFIFTNCNVSCLGNILFRKNFFLFQFCTRQRYVLVHVLKQFMSKGSMNMVKIRDYRIKMSFFYPNTNLKK